jgi:serine protease Do
MPFVSPTWRPFPLAAVVIAVGGLISAAVADEEPVPATRPTGKAAGEKTVAQLTELARRSVVIVSFNGRDGRTKGLGSGFVVSSDGLIATNLHVIGEARPIVVQTADGKKYDVKSIHATERKMDLALLKIDANGLPALPLGDSNTLKQGQRIVALGNPQGLKFSVVAGVVSGRREIDGKPMFQLAIPIERGNSGGPMLDMQGRVHGILTLKDLRTANLGFAVAINALKPLLKKPNPVAMSRWLTIGRLDGRSWKTLFGATWRQRAGRIHVQGRGSGFGGRSLALSQRTPPKLPFEVAVRVKLDDESGAAGLAFHSDGKYRHYGFYPSNGRLRLSRFEGPDVYSWKVLKEVESPQYRRGEWNTLKVRVEKDRIRCFLNDKPVIESTDATFTSGNVGLAKFRETEAEFKGFRVAAHIPPSEPSADLVREIAKLVREIPTARPPEPQLVGKLVPKNGHTGEVLLRRAKRLEQQARRLRELARLVHESKTRRQLAKLFQEKEDRIDLLKAALLIARIDNEDVDVAGYLNQVNRMVVDVSKRLKKTDTELAKLTALDKYLFEEMGFHGSRTDYYNRSNSFMNEVIDDREGLPIAVSVLYMELARRLGLKVVGVGLPGHFIVRFEPKHGESQLIDPFHRGKRMSAKDAEELVNSNGRLKFEKRHLAAQTKKQIVIRMLRNLMGTARDANDSEAMLRYVETVLVLEPKSGLDRWFRAVLNYQTLRFQESLADIDRVLKEQPADVDLDQVRQLKRIIEERLSPNGK